MPGYDILIDAWKLGNQLDVEGLCDAVLDAMNECRRNTRTIPATPLLIQVWNETPEGSEIRKLLLTWAAEYIRSSESRSEFSKSLPQELLSELVVAMSHLNSAPVIQVGNQESVNGGTQRKNVHYLEEDHEQTEHKAKMSKRTSLDIGSPNELMPKDERKAPRARSSLPNIKLVKSRKSHNKNNVEPTNEDRLIFCADLLNRMLSGPGKFNQQQETILEIILTCGRILDTSCWPFPRTRRSSHRPRSGLPREDLQTHGSRHDQDQDG